MIFRVCATLLLLGLTAEARPSRFFYSFHEPHIDSSLDSRVEVRALAGSTPATSPWLVIAEDGEGAPQQPEWIEHHAAASSETFLVRWSAQTKQCQESLQQPRAQHWTVTPLVASSDELARHLSETGGVESTLFSLISVPAAHLDDFYLQPPACPLERLDAADNLALRQERAVFAGEPLEVLKRTSAAGVERKRELLAKLISSKDAYMEKLEWLTGKTPFDVEGCSPCQVATRVSASDDLNVKATALFETLFRSWGYNVTRQEFRVGGATTHNIIASRAGAVSPDKVVVLGAHMDSTSERAASLAPGAVDNGSGTAGVLQVAEIFQHTEFEKTVQFVLFSGEEQGLIGSTHYVRQISGFTVDAALTFDMIAYSNRFFGVTVEGTTNAAIQRLMAVCKENLEEYAAALKDLRMSNNSFGSDHVPFQRAGIPAILMIERDDTNYPNYHRSTDVVNERNVNPEQSILITAGNAGALVDLAGLVEPSS